MNRIMNANTETEGKDGKSFIKDFRGKKTVSCDFSGCKNGNVKFFLTYVSDFVKLSPLFSK